MKEIYVVRESYKPNTAALVRLLSLVKGFGELGVKTKVYFLYPSSNSDIVKEKFVNVEFVYLWQQVHSSNKFYRFFYPLLVLYKIINKNIPVIFMGGGSYLPFFRLKRHVKLFHELTEHPEVSGFKNGFFSKIKRYIYIKTCSRLNGLFVISPSLYDYAIKELHIKQEKVIVINMIVDPNRFDKIFNNKGSQYITYCGTVSLYKDGVDTLIDSFYRISKDYPYLKLQIIGPFQNNLVKKQIYYLVDKLKLTDKVIFTGSIPFDNMPNILTQSKILALTRPNNKQAKYGFPTKLGEYLMTSVPVLVTNVGDISHYLHDGKEVFFAMPNSVDDIVRKMIYILDNYEQAKLVGLNGRSKALEVFNYKNEANKMISFIFG